MPLTPAWSCLTGTALVQSSHLLVIPSDHRRNSSALHISIHSSEGKKATEKARVVVERWNNILGESILGTLRAAWHQARSGCFAALGVVGVTTPHRFKGTSAAFARGSGAPRASRPPPAPHNAGSRAAGSLWDPLTKGHPRNTAQRQSPPPVPELCGGLTAAGAPSLPQHAGELTRSRRRSHVGPRGRSPFARGWGRDGPGTGQALACSVGRGERRCTTEFVSYVFRGRCAAAAEPAGRRTPGAGGRAALEGAAPLNRGGAEQGIPLAARHPRRGNPRWRSATQMPIFGNVRQWTAPRGSGRAGGGRRD